MLGRKRRRGNFQKVVTLRAVVPFSLFLVRFEFFSKLRPDDSNKTKVHVVRFVSMMMTLGSVPRRHFSIRFNFTFERAERKRAGWKEEEEGSNLYLP